MPGRRSGGAPHAILGCHEGQRSGLAWHPCAGLCRCSPFLPRGPGPGCGLDVPDTVELSAENGDKIQLFGPSHHYFEFCRGQGASIVPLLEVDDLDEARADLLRSGVELLGEPESDGAWRWLIFRG